MELTLGPVLFEWKRDEILRFYDEAARMPVDRVYVGEVVCSKKKALTTADIGSVAGMLRQAGKKVVLSSLAVVSNEEELSAVRELADLPFDAEANDMSVFNIVEGKGKTIFAGPHITSYNAPTIDFLKSLGVRRVVFPVELSGESMAYNIKQTGMAGEVFAHGKAPLAFSWRCYTSRAFGLTKGQCQRDCVKYPDGLEIKTVGGEPVFTINGTSLLSAAVYTLIEHVDDMREKGVAALRISPQYKGTARIADIWRKRINGEISPEDALRELGATSQSGFCNGWYTGKAGKDYIAGC
ncbi:MAG: U32 family peptidase [Deltaproteobacteria bacterium]|nr:U32 family peptidase [Deltaproteobacteria bacterium]